MTPTHCAGCAKLRAVLQEALETHGVLDPEHDPHWIKRADGICPTCGAQGSEPHLDPVNGWKRVDAHPPAAAGTPTETPLSAIPAPDTEADKRIDAPVAAQPKRGERRELKHNDPMASPDYGGLPERDAKAYAQLRRELYSSEPRYTLAEVERAIMGNPMVSIPTRRAIFDWARRALMRGAGGGE